MRLAARGEAALRSGLPWVGASDLDSWLITGGVAIFGPEILVEQIVLHTKAAAEHAIAELGEESLFRTHANVAAAYCNSLSQVVPLERIYRLLTLIADGNADDVERQAAPEDAREILDLWSAYWQPATVKPAEKIRESAEIPA